MEIVKAQLAMLDGFLLVNRVLNVVDDLEKILTTFEQAYPEHLTEAVFKVKNAVQRDAAYAWNSSQNIGKYSPYFGQWGLLTMATGTGKSKIPIDILKQAYNDTELVSRTHKPNVLIIVPTQNLRDNDWKNEFNKWDMRSFYDTYVTTTCYASLNNYIGECFDLVIGDEFHNITSDKESFFTINIIKRLICLTATVPTNKDKISIIKMLKLPIVYNLDLNTAARLKLVSDFKVTIIECELGNEKLYPKIKGSKILLTEQEMYLRKTQLVEQSMYGPLNFRKFLTARIMGRAKFLKSLFSITEKAIFILQHIIGPDERTLIFAGSISQAIEVCEHTYFTKPVISKKDTKDKIAKKIKQLEKFQGEAAFTNFLEKKINKLACIAKLNEGINIPTIDNLFMLAPEGGDVTLPQQIGRGIRFLAGHICNVYILLPVETVAENWVGIGLANIDKSRIKRVSYQDFINLNNKHAELQ